MVQAFACYLWLQEFLSSESSMVGAFLYMYAPYRVYDLYGRGDIGENLAFAFLPLTLFFIYRLFKLKKDIFGFGLSLSLAFLILSHNAISIISLPIIFFYYLYLAYPIRRDAKRFLLFTGGWILLGFCLSAFFWIPGVFEAKYTYRDIVTAGTYTVRSLPLAKMFFTLRDTFQTDVYDIKIGIIDTSLLMYGFYVVRKKRTARFLLLFLVLYTVIAIYFVSPQAAPIGERITFLKNFQYPWRLFAIPIFSASVIGAILVNNFPNNKRLLIGSFCIIFILFFNRVVYQPREYIQKSDDYFMHQYTGSTNSSSETSPIWSKGVTAEIWSVPFHLQRASKPIGVIYGLATYKEMKRTSTEHMYTIAVKKNAYILENTLYFPGWIVLANGREIPIHYENRKLPELVTFYLKKGNYTVLVKYSETPLRLYTDILSYASFIACLLYVVLYSYRKIAAYIFRWNIQRTECND